MTDNWEASALCARADPELFFPEKGGNVDDAKDVCSRCEVKQACLELALTIQTKVPWRVIGVWGGTSENDRRKLRAKRSARLVRPEQKAKVLELVAKGRTATEAARIAGVHYRTAMRIAKEAQRAA